MELLRVRFVPVIIYAVCVLGCKKLVDVPAPLTSLNAANVFTTDATSIAAVTGIYTEMSNEAFSNGGITAVSLFPSLSADELSLYSGQSNTSYNLYYSYLLSNSNTGSSDFWLTIYPYIYLANSALDGLNNSSGLTPSIKQELLGESKFMRAFFYFYLVNLYGDVPLVLSSDYKANANLPRSATSNVYQQIIADLKDAQALLSTGYLDGTLLNQSSERTRPNQPAATGLLARAYLYTKQWDSAEMEASVVINNPLYSLDTLNGVFLMNSPEAIWQLQPVTGSTNNTQQAIFFIIPPAGPGPAFPVYLSNNLLNAFEQGDLRRADWVDSTVASGVAYYYPYKYKINNVTLPVAEYIMVLRLAEQYLIRAEARAQQGNLTGAIADLNTIRARAGLSGTSVTTQSDLLAAIQHERQVELFTEWGDRWLNLKRTGAVNTVMTTDKASLWSNEWQLYPIPLTELKSDLSLTQNAGY
jgi:hypothetical protein